jgi:fumarate reductase subunit D
VTSGDSSTRRYRTLDPAQIIDTAEKLEERIAARFPDTGLRRVSAELVALSRDLAKSAKALEEPIWWARGLATTAVIAGAVVFIFVGTILPFDRFPAGDAAESVQGIEASINTLLLAGLGLLALIRAEEGIKRRRVFRELHGLRSLIHVIDMHQLTKDPAALSKDFRPTAQSPERITDRFELARYLDYCSEMLSVTGKIAALFAQSVNDAVVIETVNDIEELGTNLSRKIWQKIALIDHNNAPKAKPGV